ncbi:helix-turn-helix transcriptional regulator [bacterium]|nr:helix-turn-helix transcriptional regulator [bacterium]
MRTFSPQLLRQARRDARMSQEMLARKTGLSRAAIAAIEGGVNVPLCNTLALLAWALCKTEAYFFADPVQTTEHLMPIARNG